MAASRMDRYIERINNENIMLHAENRNMRLANQELEMENRNLAEQNETCLRELFVMIICLLMTLAICYF